MSNLRSATVHVALTVLLATATGACTGEASDTQPDGGDATTTRAASPTQAAADPDAPLTMDEAGAETIEALPFPDFAIALDDRVWVSGVDDGLVAYDAASGEIVASSRVGDVFAGLDARDGRVYLVESPSRGSNLVVLDSTTGDVVARTRLPAAVAEESSVAAGPRAAYALLADGRLAVADPARSRSRVLRAPEGAAAVRFGFGSLWVSTSSGHVVRVDPTTGEPEARIAVGPSPRFLTVGHGAVWVMNQGDGSVTRIDPDRNRATVTINASQTGISGGDIAAGPHGIWLHAEAIAAILIDPDTNKVTHRVGVGLGSGGIAEATDNLWITAHDRFAIYQVPWPPPPE